MNRRRVRIQAEGDRRRQAERHAAGRDAQAQAQGLAFTGAQPHHVHAPRSILCGRNTHTGSQIQCPIIAPWRRRRRRRPSESVYWSSILARPIRPSYCAVHALLAGFSRRSTGHRYLACDLAADPLRLRIAVSPDPHACASTARFGCRTARPWRCTRSGWRAKSTIDYAPRWETGCVSPSA